MQIFHSEGFMSEGVSNCAVLPINAAAIARRSLGLAVDAPLRIAFVAGPGDACGTFNHWIKDAHDPRTPVIAYSSMFYSVVAGLNGTALILIEQNKQPFQTDQRFQFVYTPRRRTRGGIGYHIDQASFSRSVLRHLQDFNPDVIVVGTDAPDRLIRRLPKAKRIILTTHNTFWPKGMRPRSFRGSLGLWLKARAIRRIDVAVNTSSECAAQVTELGGPSGINSFIETPQVLDSFYPQALRPACSVSRLLYLGRIEFEKGVFDLLKAFTQLAATHPKLRLDFAGTGSAENALKQAIVATNIGNKITVHGQLSAKEVHSLLDESDLLICPTRSSFSEGLALVVIEAAVHGVPTLLSSAVPAKALIPEGCVEFPVDDTEALCAALARIVEDELFYSALRQAVFSKRSQFRDRATSWGTQLYRALSLPPSYSTAKIN